MIDNPDIKDMFSMQYTLGELGLAPPFNSDRGRVRYLPLFKKMYGDCHLPGFMSNAENVLWLPSKGGKSLRFTRINGAAAALQRVSDELGHLPDRFVAYLRPTQGTYNCRGIAGTSRPSPHSFGIAIDIAASHSHYWQWSKPATDGRISYRNEVPPEIVRIFEEHGFIWGGRAASAPPAGGPLRILLLSRGFEMRRGENYSARMRRLSPIASMSGSLFGRRRSGPDL